MGYEKPIRSHRDLAVWQCGLDIAEQIYALSADWPREEAYGLTAQLRRAGASVPANIAEGNARDSTKDYLRFLGIAQGSLAEVETFLTLAARLRYCDEVQLKPLYELINLQRRMLYGLQRSLRAKLRKTN